jgi:hypothetical protein
MRKVLNRGLMGLFLLPLVAMVGCGGAGAKATLPTQKFELPKDPVAAGAPGQEEAAQKTKQAAD